MFSAAGKSAVTSGYNINNSLRFRASASARLSRTFGTPTNTSTWTFSAWIKRGDLAPTTAATIIASRPSSTTTAIYFNATGNLVFWNNEAVAATSTAIFRDPAAWYHVVVSSNGTTTTAYVNNQTVLTWTGDLSLINNLGTHYIGHAATTGNRDFDGYFAETYFVDGQALTQSSFGELDTTTGVWKPKAYTGTYGTNGFYLKFSDIALTSGSNAGLGKDFSGNSNYWTTTNISVTSDSTYDAMTDSPTLTSATVSNYCTANPLDASPSGTSVLSNGNLTVNVSGSSAGGGYGGQARCNTINFTNISGKWYWEAFIDNAGTGAATLRLTFFMDDEPVSISAQSGPWAWYWRADGLTDLTGVSSGFATNDVVMFAYDSDSGKLWVGKNGTWLNSGVPASGTGQVKTLTALAAYALGLNYGTSGGGTGTASFNFGQRPFTYTPPTGFLALNTFNLPTSTIVKGNSFMDAVLWTGNGTNNRAITQYNFYPDFTWIKQRSAGYFHVLSNSVAGVNRALNSNSTNAETTNGIDGYTSAFSSTGFTLTTGTTSINNVNQSGQTYVGWAWNANNGSSVSNTNGTIPSTVSVNTSAGFSIVSFTGTATNATVGHGLGVAPKMIIEKCRSSGLAADIWNVYHTSTGAGNYLRLNGTQTSTAGTTWWNNTAPTSSVFSIGTENSVNKSGETYIAYCWAEIAGFSAFGSYTGNGSTDGPFVYTGFRPKFLLVKNTTTVGTNWFIFDSVRDTFNVMFKRQQVNTAPAEETNLDPFDFLSNGFKLRDTNSAWNSNGATFIYAAFAENPFKNALAR